MESEVICECSGIEMSNMKILSRWSTSIASKTATKAKSNEFLITNKNYNDKNEKTGINPILSTNIYRLRQQSRQIVRDVNYDYKSTNTQ